MEPMQWLTLAIFAVTIVAVVTNVIDSTLAALIGVAVSNSTMVPAGRSSRSRRSTALSWSGRVRWGLMCGF